jgi:4-hydroxyproline epimerase
VQESIVGSLFTASYTRRGDEVIPTITGTAFVNSEATVLLDERDPFCWGLR